MLDLRLSPPGFNATRNIVMFEAQGTVGADGTITAGTTIGRGLTLAKSATGTYTATIKPAGSAVGAILYANAVIIGDTPQVATVKSLDPSTGVATFEVHTLGDTNNDDNADVIDTQKLAVFMLVRNSPDDGS